MTNLITSTTSVALTGDQKVDGLFSGSAWDGTITYAFPTTSASYSYSGEKDYSFSSISSQQQSFALFFMEQSYGNTANDGFSVEGFTNANFQAGSAETASVRFAQSWMPPTAWAYYPDSPEAGGDVWFGTSYAGTEDDLRFPEFGNYAGHTLAHELGHALGLKHAHEGDASNTTVVPSAYDSLEYTIMTYHTYVGDDLSGIKYEHDGAPQTFMMLDIAALQEMYGADYTTNSGNTVYKWNPNQGITYVNGVAAITPDANRIFATVWDGGGIDTYDLSAYSTGLNINLQPGSYSVFSQGQLADLGGGPNSGYARGNIFNALLYHGNLASLIENVQAGSGNDTIVGNDANNTLWGNAGNDSLAGGIGNDTLIGGAGLDTMSGGVGDDVYIVDNANDAVIENANGGTDTVQTALASYTMSTNVETLTYTGTGAFTGTGNATANTIIGGGGNDWLNGAAGADSLIGGTGDDTYFVDNAADLVTENASQGTDTVRTSQLISYTLGVNVENLTYTGTGAFSGIGNGLDNTITGGAAADTLLGGDGNDWLNGAAGADSLLGDTGNDTYSVDNIADIVTENAGEGTDTVRTSQLISYTLGANVENLTYTGLGDFNGTGNGLDNTIAGSIGKDRLTGGAGNDWLNGAAGADSLLGGTGNDTYSVDNIADVVTENASEGTDTVRTSQLASYTLGANVENLTYTGTGAFSGIGNGLDNTITGGVGDDRLSGGTGNDTLIGGAGLDTMSGGVGDDVYVVDIATDAVIENANEGTDTVQTALASFTIGTNVETLTYTGTGAFTGTGNATANTIIGGDGNDWLNGAAGADTLIAGIGNDTYSVDNVADVVTENADEGTDTVRTSQLASYTLAANVENLTYTGTEAFSGTGNGL
ncbi:M10 family metallopeptidase, partial [Rhizobium indigoferae]